MLIQDRVKLIIKANNESSSSFADKIDIKRSNLSHVLSGRNKPSLDFLAKIIDNYPKVNASWLITGTTRDGELKEPINNTQESIKPKTEGSFVDGEIEKIVVFYTNGTFSSYTAS